MCSSCKKKVNLIAVEPTPFSLESRSHRKTEVMDVNIWGHSAAGGRLRERQPFQTKGTT